MQKKRKPVRREDPWALLGAAVRRTGVPRSTLVGRIARGEVKTKRFGGEQFIDCRTVTPAKKRAG